MIGLRVGDRDAFERLQKRVSEKGTVRVPGIKSPPEVGATELLVLKGPVGEIERFEVVVEKVDGRKVTVKFGASERDRLQKANFLGALSRDLPAVDDLLGDAPLEDEGEGRRPLSGRLGSVSGAHKATTGPQRALSGQRRAVSGANPTMSGSQVAAPKRPRVNPGLVAVGLLLVAGVVFALTAGAPSQSSDWPPAGTSEPNVADLNLTTITSAVPATPAGARLDWALSRVNGQAALQPSEFGDAFAASVLSRVSENALIAAFEDLRERAPFVLEGFVEEPTDTTLVAALSTGTGAYMAVIIEVEAAAPHRLRVLDFANWR